MKCKKCGTTYSDTEVFCSNCGEPISNNSIIITSDKEKDNPVESPVIDNSIDNISRLNENEPVSPAINDKTEETNIEEKDTDTSEVFISNESVSNNPIIKPKSSSKKLWLIIGIISILFVVFIVLYFVFKGKKNELTCTSNTGTITIKFTDKKIVDYVTVDSISFDENEYNEIIKNKGIDEFVYLYNKWFSTNKFGTCFINGEQLEPNEEDIAEDDNYSNIEVKEVGDEARGYVDIPSDWNKFVDASGASALQYSLANVYILSLDVVDNSNYNAEQQAKIFLNSMKQDTTILNLQANTVTIGKDKKYNVYQVSMLYPSENKYLITYWFDAEDEKVHYIGLEGPEKLPDSDIGISDFVLIPKSFRLKN